MSLAIGLAAWHAHGLSSLSPDAYEAFGRGIHQQTIMALGLMLVALRMEKNPTPLFAWLALAFAVGGCLFCGDVYWGALHGEGLGVAPFGGSLSILTWFLLALQTWWSKE